MPNTPNNSSLTTKHSLIERVRDPDDKDAWKEFISYYEQYIMNILLRMGLSASDAEESQQIINIKLWKSLPQFAYEKDGGKFRRWLSTVIKNHARNVHRNKKTLSKYIDQDEEDSEGVPENEKESALDKLISEEWYCYISNLAWDTIKTRFEENTQNVFLLHADGKTPEEIAEICKIKESSVHVYIHRIRQHLKDEIQRLNSELL